MARKVCANCGKELKTLNVKYTLSDDSVVCWKCVREAGYGTNASFLVMKHVSLTELQENKLKIDLEQQKIQDNIEIEKQKQAELTNVFTTTKNVGVTLEIDIDHQLFRLNAATIYKLTDLNDFEIIEDGETKSSGGLGRAAIGGVAFGGVGAIVGAVTGSKKNKELINTLQIKLNMNNFDTPVLYIHLIGNPTKKDSLLYRQAIKKADEILSVLDISMRKIEENKISQVNESAVDFTDQIRKYKGLLDDGIITQEEFDIKKKELLNL